MDPEVKNTLKTAGISAGIAAAMLGAYHFTYLSSCFKTLTASVAATNLAITTLTQSLKDKAILTKPEIRVARQQYAEAVKDNAGSSPLSLSVEQPSGIAVYSKKE